MKIRTQNKVWAVALSIATIACVLFAIWEVSMLDTCGSNYKCHLGRIIMFCISLLAAWFLGWCVKICMEGIRYDKEWEREHGKDS